MLRPPAAAGGFFLDFASLLRKLRGKKSSALQLRDSVSSEQSSVTNREGSIMRYSFVFVLSTFLVTIFAGCGSTSRYNAISIPCARPYEEILRSAREQLLSKGFSPSVYRPDSGYYRTAAKKVQTVSEISSQTPLWFVVEVRCLQDHVEVAGYSLIYGKHSQALQFGTSPENESQTEEEGIIPGTRAYSAIIYPLVEHLREFCRE
jgi:hypothetical protein